MTDLAKIGFAAETSPLKQAADDVQAFGDKAAKAGDQVEQANAKFAKGKESASVMGAGMKEAGAGAEAASGSIKSVTGAVEASSQVVQKAAGFWKSFTQSFGQEFRNAINGSTDALQKAVEPNRNIEAAASRAGVSYQEMAARVANAGSVVAAVTPVVEKHTIASKAMGVEHKATSEATKELREAAHTLAPALEAAGVQMGAMTRYSGALRAGLPALGAAIAGGVVVELAKMADEAEKARVRLEGLGGARLGGQYAESLRGITKELGLATQSVAPAYEALLKLVNLRGGNNSGVQILGPGLPDFLDKAKFSAENAGKAIEGLFEQLKLGGASTKEATAATNAFFADLTKNEALTGDALRKLEQAAPRAAQSITNAMTGGRLSAEQYAAALDKAPASIDKIMGMLLRLAAGSRDAFREMEEHPKTVEGAVDKLEKAFRGLWDAIDPGDKSGIVASSISAIADAVKSATPYIVAAKDAYLEWQGAIETALGKGLGAIGKFVMDGFQSMADFGNRLIDGTKATWASVASAISDGTGVALSAVGDFVQGAIDKLGALAQAAMKSAQTVASAIAGMFKGGGGAGANTTDPMGNPTGGGGSDNFDSSGSQSGGFLTPSGDAGTIDFGDLGGGSGGITDNLPGFATGGSFQVGGSGGTDSQLVQFKASPWETVTISGGAASPGAAVAPGLLQGGSASSVADSVNQAASVKQITDAIDASTIDISKQVQAGSDQIVSALNKLSGGSSAAVVNPSTGAVISTTASAPRSLQSGDLGRSGPGGGGFNTQKSTDKPPPQQASIRPQDWFGNPAYGYPGGAFGQGSPVKGASFGRRPSYVAPGSGRGPDGLIHPPGGQLDQYGMPKFQPPDGMSSPSDPFSGRSQVFNPFGDMASTSDSLAHWGWRAYLISNGAPTMRSAVNPYYDPYSAYGGGGISDATSSYTMPYDSQYYDPYSAGVTPDGSGFPSALEALSAQYDSSAYDSGGFDYAYDSGGFDYAFNSFGNDTGAMDYGGGSVDAGYFAGGGSFTVPGAGGVDNQDVTLHARPGEQVSVTTPEQQKNGSGSSDRPIIVNQYFTGDGGNLNSSMSRAQTQRMIRGALG